MSIFHLRVKNPHGFTGAQPNLCNLVSSDFITTESYKLEVGMNMAPGVKLCSLCVSIFKAHEQPERPQMLITALADVVMELPRDLLRVLKSLNTKIRGGGNRIKQIRGRFLSNTYDPGADDAQRYLTYSYNAWANGPGAMEQEWQHHMDWVDENLIRKPKGTKYYTVEELEAENMVGIYQPLYRTLSSWSQFRYLLGYFRFQAWRTKVTKYLSRREERLRFDSK